MGRAKLLQAIGSRLTGDSELDGLVQNISWRRNPDDPQKLNDPHVAYNVFGDPDEEDLHGAATNPEFEFRIWGYGYGMAINVEKAAARINELLLSDFSLSDGSEAFKLRAVIGWQDTPQPDPKTILYLNRYATRLWSQDRISAVDAN